MKINKTFRALFVVVSVLAVGLTSVQAAILTLSGIMPSDGDVKDFQISPDSRYVVYLANQLNTTATELYSVPITGTTPIRLNAPIQDGLTMVRFQISPLSDRVVFTRPKFDSGLPYSELFSAPIDGSTSAIKLNGPLAVGGSIWGFGITADGQQVVYVADQDTDNVKELYSAPIDGSALPTKLNPTLVSGGNVLDTQFRLTPNDQRVVYVADKDSDEVFELYSVPVTGPMTATVKLSGTMTNGGDIGYMLPLGTPTYFHLTPDNAHVVYFADQDTNDLVELYSAPVDGSSAAIKLHQPLTGGQTLVPYRISISNNSQKVSFTINEQVYVAPITGPAGSATSLHDANLLGATVILATITKDNQFVVVYKTISTNPAIIRTYRIPINGPANAATAVFDGGPFAISDDSKFVIFNTNGSGNAPLYSMPLTGTQASAIKIADNTAGIPSFIISPNNQRAIYRGGWLFSVPITGPADAKYPLSAQTNNGGGIAYYSGFQVSPDSRYVVYISDGDTLNKFELYSASEFGNFPNKVYLPFIRR